MELKKLIRLLAVCIVCFAGVAGILQIVKLDEMSKYSAPIEVRYVAENVIQNSEGRIYEYEYELKTEENNTIFWHSAEKEKLSNKVKISYWKGEQQNTNDEIPNSIVSYETVENKEKGYEKWQSYFLGLVIGFVLFESIVISGYFLKKHSQEKEKKKLLDNEKFYEQIFEVKEFIKKNYPDFKEISDSLNKISKMISTLDDFYEGRKDEAIYNNGLKREIRNIVDSYLKNMEIDKQFKNQKLIKKELHRELQSTLEKFLVRVQSQIASLTDENDSRIYQELDKINSESQLSGDAIKCLAEKYEKK